MKSNEVENTNSELTEEKMTVDSFFKNYGENIESELEFVCKNKFKSSVLTKAGWEQKLKEFRSTKVK